VAAGCNITTVSLPYTQASGCLPNSKPNKCNYYAFAGNSSNCNKCCFLCSRTVCACANTTIQSYNVGNNAVCVFSNTETAVCFSGQKDCTVVFCVCYKTYLRNCDGGDELVVNGLRCCSFFYQGSSPCCKLFTTDNHALTTLPQSFTSAPWCIVTCYFDRYVVTSLCGFGNSGPVMTPSYTTFCTHDVGVCCQVFCINFSSFYVPCCIMLCQHCTPVTATVTGYDEATGCVCVTANTWNYVYEVGQRFGCSICYHNCVCYKLLNESGCSTALGLSCCLASFSTVCCCQQFLRIFRVDDTFTATLPSSYACECWCLQTDVCFNVTNFGTWNTFGSSIDGQAASFKVPIPFTGLAFSFEF